MNLLFRTMGEIRMTLEINETQTTTKGMILIKNYFG